MFPIHMLQTNSTKQSKARVLNKYKDAIPSDAIYIGRPTKWGNPFAIGKDGNREEVIAKFEQYVRDNKQLQKQIKRELRNKDLVCYCSPLICHGDLLLKIANEE